MCLCAVTFITEISLHVALSNPSDSTTENLSEKKTIKNIYKRQKKKKKNKQKAKKKTNKKLHGSYHNSLDFARAKIWVYWCLRHMQRYFSQTCDGKCAGGLKKLYLRSGSQRHRHFAGFFNVPVLHRHGTTLFRRWFRHTAPFSRLYDTLGIRRTYSGLDTPGVLTGVARAGNDLIDTFIFFLSGHRVKFPCEDAGGLSREYVLRIPSVS